MLFKLINNVEVLCINVADCYVTCAAFGLVLLIMFYYSDEDMAVFNMKKKGGKQ